MNDDNIPQRLRAAVTERLKKQFVGRAEVIDLIALAVVAGEHLFLFGPPGTAKSALIRAFATAVEGRYFEYLLTRFSEPNEVFGPIDLVKLREGTVATVTSGMLPEAEFVFLDELFNANSAILNNLLTVLNERLYRRGREVVRLPLLSLFSASNHLPEDEALAALFDRFLLRCKVEPLPRDHMGALLDAGWAARARLLHRLQQRRPLHGGRSAKTCKPCHGSRPFPHQRAVCRRRVQSPRSRHRLLRPARREGAEADRRVGRAQRGAPLPTVPTCGCCATCGIARNRSLRSHHWSKHSCGNNRLTGHIRWRPRRSRVDGEQLARELADAETRLSNKSSLVELARLREQVSRVADRAAWVVDEAARRHLVEKAGNLLHRIGS